MSKKRSLPVPSGIVLPPLPLLAALLLASCGGDSPSTPTAPVDSGATGTPTALAFPESSYTLDRWEDTASAPATATDAAGRAVSTTVTYSSSDTDVVRVTSAGQLTSWRAGTVTITARAAGLTATTTVNVRMQGNARCTVPGTFSAAPVAAPYSFQTVELAPATTDWGSAAIPIDIDQDGDIDVLQMDQDPVRRETYTSYLVFLNDGGTLSLSSERWFGDPTPFNGPRDYVVTDINGDGLMDLYLAQPGYDPGGVDGLDATNTIADGAYNVVLLAKPGGGFENVAASALVPNRQHGFTHAGDMADVDCDGDPDLFQANWPNDNAPERSNLRINEGGVLTEANARIAGWPTQTTGLSGSAFCDLDRDGDPDLVMAPAPGEPILFVNDGFGNFRALSTAVFPPSRSGGSANTYSDLSCGDLTGDGLPELVAHDHSFNSNFGKWAVFRNEGDMTFSSGNEMLPDPEGVYAFAPGGGPAMMYDFNGDGWMDLLGGASADYPLQVMFNTGGSGFTSVLLPGFGGTAAFGMQPAVADYDGDGRLDVYMQGGHGYNTLLAYGR